MSSTRWMSCMATNYVLELLQSGERIRGKSKIRELHANFPSRVHFVTHRVVGEGDHWVCGKEPSVTNDGMPMNRIAVLEFRRGRMAHETDYFCEPFPAPDWRARYVEPKVTS